MSEDDDIVLGRPGHEPGDAGTPLWHENQRKAMEEMNAGLADQLRATPMSEAQPETVTDPVVEAQKALVTAIWHCISDASSMNVVMSGGEVNAAMRHFRLAIEAEACAAGAARYETALRDRIKALPWAIYHTPTGAYRLHGAVECDEVLALLTAPVPEPLPQGDGLDVERLAFVRVLKAAWELTHSSGSGHYVRAFDDLREAVLAATPSRPAEERKP